jgi:hypothetical protein
LNALLDAREFRTLQNLRFFEAACLHRLGQRIGIYFDFNPNGFILNLNYLVAPICVIEELEEFDGQNVEILLVLEAQVLLVFRVVHGLPGVLDLAL